MDDRFGDDPRTNRERMLAGDLYVAEDPELAAALRWATRLADEYNALAPRDWEAAREILASLLGGLGGFALRLGCFRQIERPVGHILLEARASAERKADQRRTCQCAPRPLCLRPNPSHRCPHSIRRRSRRQPRP